MPRPAAAAAGQPTGRPHRLRLAAPVPSETALHEAVAQALTVLLPREVMWTCFPAGHVALDGQQAARLFRMGLKRGWPDLLVLWGGRIHGLELKCGRRGLSRSGFVRTRRGHTRWVEGQTDVFPRLEAQGMRIVTATSVEEALRALAMWGVPVRRWE